VTLAVSDAELGLVRSILTRIVPDAAYLAFGSRLGECYHRYSDLDIAVRAAGPISLSQLSALEEAFAESDLPFRVDIVDLHRASPEFRHFVESSHVRT
jgi:type I restriction enzyme S subunit